MPDVLRVLIVEDTSDDTQMLVRELRKGGYEPDFEEVLTPEAFRAALSERTWDVIIADWHLPSFSAPAALAILKASGRDLPFLIVSGYVGEAEAVTAMKSGAHDFIGKSNLARLVPAVERELREAGVRRRTRQLEVALEKAEKMETIGRFAGQIASEFDRTLVRIGAACGSLASRLGRDAAERADVEAIQEAAENAGMLTLQLTTLSRNEPLQRELVDFNALLGARYEQLRRLVGAKLDLTMRLGPELGRISADPSGIEQLILCLVMNARDVAGPGGRIVIETGDAELGESYEAQFMAVKPGSYVTLSVAAIGRGAVLPVRQPERDGGLGMAIIYRTVKQSGGDISVESVPGRSETLTIFLPRAAEPLKDRPAPAAAKPEKGFLATVLVAGEDEQMRRALESALAHGGYLVLEARDGRTARLIARSYSGSIDVLLTPIMLTDMSGGELAQELAAMRPGMKIFYACSSVDAATTVRAGRIMIDARRTAGEIVEQVAQALESGTGTVAK